MWTTVYIASGKDWAEEVENRLSYEGFIVKTRFFAMEGNKEL